MSSLAGTRWIPITRPPDSTRPVLVWEPASGFGYAFACYHKSNRKGEQWISYDCEYIEVSHWRPLPILPRGTSDK
jgi:hypothetical protein